MVNRRNMVHRTLFYMSKLFITSIRAGDNYAQLKKTIVINLLDYELLVTERFHSTFHFYEDHERSFRLTDLLEVHIIEFPKFERAAKDTSVPLHRWLMFMDEKLPEERLKELMKMDPMIEVTEEQLEGMSRDEFMRRVAEMREKAQMDWVSSIEDAKQEGKIEGKIEGKVESQTEIVLKMLEKGMKPAQISELLDLPIDKVNRILAGSRARQRD